MRDPVGNAVAFYLGKKHTIVTFKAANTLSRPPVSSHGKALPTAGHSIAVGKRLHYTVKRFSVHPDNTCTGQSNVVTQRGLLLHGALIQHDGQHHQAVMQRPHRFWHIEPVGIFLSDETRGQLPGTKPRVG